VLTPVLFKLPIPSSRSWCRPVWVCVAGSERVEPVFAFSVRWIAVFTGLLYVIVGLLSGHFVKNFDPRESRSFRASALEGMRQPFAVRAAWGGKKPGRTTCSSGLATCSSSLFYFRW